MRRKQKMTKAKLLVITASALTLAASVSAASAQGLPEGRVYAFHSHASGACPALDWYVTIGAGNTLSGMISWNDMKSIAHATGTYNAPQAGAGTFTMSAHESGGEGRTATIDGQVRKDGWLVMNISGPNVTCAGVAVPWVQAPSNG
jgi:hypothetical protein